MITLLPADKYVVVNKTILTEYDRKLLVSLYEPIIGQNAVSLYLTLWRDLDRYTLISVDYTHHHLMTILKSGLEDIKLSRKALEAMGLLRTYYQAGEINSYVYELYSPLTPKEFFANPIFNVVLYNNIGSAEYNLLKQEFSPISFSLKEYEDITAQFDSVFKSSNNYNSNNNNLPKNKLLNKNKKGINIEDPKTNKFFDIIITPNNNNKKEDSKTSPINIFNKTKGIYHRKTVLLRTVTCFGTMKMKKN